MDHLDRIGPSAEPLLARVDDTLRAAGAAPEHPVWAELRRVRLLPGDAVRTVAALRADTLRSAVPALGAARETVAGMPADLPGPGAWQGPAADRYVAGRDALAAHLEEDLTGRLDASAAWADSAARWVGDARDRIAVMLAEVLVSAEAVTLSAPVDGEREPWPIPAGGMHIVAWPFSPGASAVGDRAAAGGPAIPGPATPGPATPGPVPTGAASLAAADIAAQVLQVVADVYDRAAELYDDGAGLTAEARCRS